MKTLNNHNYFFKIYIIGGEEIVNIHIYTNADICKNICEKYFNNTESSIEFNKDSYNFIYGKNIKEQLNIVAPNVIAECNKLCDVMEDDDIGICMITEYEYRKSNKQYDNEKSFIESMELEIEFQEKQTLINIDILKEAGFEEITMPKMSAYHKEMYGQDNYVELRLWTTDNINDKNCLKLDIDNGPNNRGTNWHLHIDNNACESIGSADINNIWEFNTLMKIFGSKFRL